jgi:hypothetical protein
MVNFDAVYQLKQGMGKSARNMSRWCCNLSTWTNSKTLAAGSVIQRNELLHPVAERLAACIHYRDTACCYRGVINYLTVPNVRYRTDCK